MTTQTRFAQGDQVMYVGSRSRQNGRLFYITGVSAYTNSENRYSLHDGTWGERLDRVRESSLRSPDDDI